MKRTVVGVISDTHGLLRPEAVAALAGSELILHAGDVGKPEILEALKAVAPTVAVRGNVDTDAWARALAETEVVDVAEARFYMLHDVAQLDLVPRTAGFAAVVFGHSHRPEIRFESDVLFLNPGSAGPRRFRLPISVARVVIEGRTLRPEIVELHPKP